MASQKHEIKNKPSSSRASVGSRDLVPVSRRSTSSSGKLQSQGSSSTSTQLNLSSRSNAGTIHKEEHRKQSVQICSSGKKSTTKISSSKQMVERVSGSSRGSQTTTKIGSSKQMVERVSGSSRGSQTTTKISSSKQREEREMVRHEHGSFRIDMRNRSKMQFEKTKKNYVSSEGHNVTRGEKFRIGFEFELEMKY